MVNGTILCMHSGQGRAYEAGRQVNNRFDPTIHEALEIILDKYGLSLDNKLTELRTNQAALRGIISALSLALKDQDGIDWAKFLSQQS